MTNLKKSAVTIGRMPGTVAGKIINSASEATFKKYPYLSYIG